MPTSKLGYVLELRGTGTLLSDSNGIANDTFTAESISKMRFYGGGMLWRPRHRIKYLVGTQENPVDDVIISSGATELNNRLRLEGTRSDLGSLGELRIVGEHEWRRRNDAVGSDTKNKILGELGLSRRFNRAWRLMISIP